LGGFHHREHREHREHGGSGGEKPTTRNQQCLGWKLKPEGGSGGTEPIPTRIPELSSVLSVPSVVKKSPLGGFHHREHREHREHGGSGGEKRTTRNQQCLGWKLKPEGESGGTEPIPTRIPPALLCAPCALCGEKIAIGRFSPPRAQRAPRARREWGREANDPESAVPWVEAQTGGRIRWHRAHSHPNPSAFLCALCALCGEKIAAFISTPVWNRILNVRGGQGFSNVGLPWRRRMGYWIKVSCGIWHSVGS
jgi:hypothetical protein